MKKRRKNKEIRKLILNSFKGKSRTIHEISSKTGLHWLTCKHHLIYLKGLDLVKEVFRHRQIWLFEITGEGLKYLKKRK